MTALAVIGASLSGCERIDYIELVPNEVVFKQPNNQTWMEAKCMARNGVRAVKARVEWSTGDGAIAKVNNKGMLTPVADGDTEVIARVGDVEARVPVQVIYVDKIEVEPKELKILDTASAVKPTIKAFRKNGKPITDRSPTLTAGDKKIVLITGSGEISPLDPGETTVSVQVDGASASIKVIVEADKTKK
ncbi:MAG: Ig-like domain-containing protein [Archangium sp.]